MKFGSAQSHYSVLGSYHSSSSFQRCLSVRGLRERPLSTKGTIIRGRFVGLSAQAGSPMPNDLGADLLGPSDEPSLAQVGSSAICITRPGRDDIDTEDDLNYEPTVSILEYLGLGLLSASICVLIGAAIGFSRINIRSGLGLGMIWAGSMGLARIILREKKYQSRARSETELGDSESNFRTVEHTNVHFKCQQPNSASSRGIHLYHGFGANVYTWRDVEKPMSRELNALVTSHDSPGFGLTQRSTNLRDYSFEYNGQLGRSVLQSQIESTGQKSQAGCSAPTDISAAGDSLEKEIILVGHSMGCISAAYEAVNNPSNVSGLVLIAPALFAPQIQDPAESQSTEMSEKEKDVGTQIGRRLYSVWKCIVKSFLKSTTGLVLWCSQPFLALSLRWAARPVRFWEKGLRRAYYNEDLLDRRTILSYRLPQLVRGWEWGLARFVRSRTSSAGKGFLQNVKDAWNLKASPTLLQRLALVLQEHKIRLLIVHGENDGLVPCANSERLEKILPNSQLQSIENCGHCPHEEFPEHFMEMCVQWVSDPTKCDDEMKHT